MYIANIAFEKNT